MDSLHQPVDRQEQQTLAAPDKPQTTKHRPANQRRTPLAAAKPEKIFPIVKRMCEEVNLVFARFVGPIGPDIAEIVYLQWLRMRNTGPGGVHKYIHLLSLNIPDEDQRLPFYEEARQCIRLDLLNREN